jgi:hypothetical protein
MTDIEAKALALVNKVLEGKALDNTPFTRLPTAVSSLVLLRAIEQHEAFKQEVSDVMMYIRALYPSLPRNFYRFIIPKPKPDPLVEAVHEVDTGPAWDSPEDYCNKIRAALEARGFEIRSKSDDR